MYKAHVFCFFCFNSLRFSSLHWGFPGSSGFGPDHDEHRPSCPHAWPTPALLLLGRKIKLFCKWNIRNASSEREKGPFRRHQELYQMPLDLSTLSSWRLLQQCSQIWTIKPHSFSSSPLTRRDREVVDFMRYRVKNYSKLTNFRKFTRIEGYNGKYGLNSQGIKEFLDIIFKFDQIGQEIGGRNWGK